MVPSMRIKAVLRDNQILGMEPGSKDRIVATAMKNLDRIVSQSSILKVMGLKQDARATMLEALKDKDIHIWLANEAQQDIIYLSKEDLPDDFEIAGYKWQ